MGIGTTSPASPLHIKLPNSSTAPIVTFDRNDGAVRGEIKYDDTAAVRGFQIGTTTQHDLVFKTDNTTRLQITYNGNVGIGTASPDKELHTVNASQSVANRVAYNGTYYTDYGYHQVNTQSNDFVLKTTGTTRMTVKNDTGYIIAAAGVTFGTDTAAANALDDYEEGTWTPAASGGASSASGTYTKVGRLVTCNGTLTFPSQTNSARATVEGLPFTSLNVDHGFTGTIRYTDYNPRQLMIHGDNNATTFGLYEIDYGSAATQTSWTEISGKRFDFSLMYFV